MRSTDQRISAIHKKVREQRILRRRVAIEISSIVAVLAIIIGLGLTMPHIMESVTADGPQTINGIAGIFALNGELGYIVVSLLAFALGISVTLLCVTLHAKSHRDEEDTHDRNS